MTLEEFKKALQAIRLKALEIPQPPPPKRGPEIRSLKKKTPAARGRFFGSGKC
jgi:hypothetical protein